MTQLLLLGDSSCPPPWKAALISPLPNAVIDPDSKPRNFYRKSVKLTTEEIFLTQPRRSVDDDAFSPFTPSASHVWKQTECARGQQLFCACAERDTHAARHSARKRDTMSHSDFSKQPLKSLDKPLIHWAACHGWLQTVERLLSAVECCSMGCMWHTEPVSGPDDSRGESRHDDRCGSGEVVHEALGEDTVLPQQECWEGMPKLSIPKLCPHENERKKKTTTKCCCCYQMLIFKIG